MKKSGTFPNVVYRPIEAKDFSALCEISKSAGIGITSLQYDEKKLANRIELSIESMKKSVLKPSSEKYLFVLEDLNKKKVIGTSGVTACIGEEIPFYNYRISTTTRFCKELNIRHYYDSLSLVNDYHGASEVGSLLLTDGYRGSGVGRFLSRVRFLFIANFSERFADLIIAEMRGVSDEEGRSPFWESLGRHFFKMDFEEADRLCELTNKQFIADLMPRSPIYTELLSRAAQESIGKSHPLTLPAFNILKNEGFTFRGYIDIFDGGPAIEVMKNQIHTIRDSQLLKVSQIQSIPNGNPWMISTIEMPFLSCVDSIQIIDGECVLNTSAADKLQMREGLKVRVCRL